MMRKREFILITLLVVLMITVPYVYAAQNGGNSLEYNGFLINAVDGNTYLAKMREGWLGSWQFTNLYSSVPARPTFIYLFYIFLGHLSRWLGLPLLIVFHGARVLASILLLWTMYRFVEVFLGSQSRKVKTIAFLVMSLGAGTGWLASLFGRATADLWVPEAFPFLAMSTNPHFPLGLAILLGFLIQIRLPYRRYYPILLIIEGIVAAITMQFIVPVGAAIAGALQLYEVIKKLHPIRWWMLWFFVPAGLILVYQIVSMNSDPVLAGWSAQNVTPSPPFWDVLVSFSPMFLFALGSIVWLVKTKNVNSNRLLVVWLIIGMFLPYVPYQLQRRLSTAYFIPVAGLAALSIGLLLNHSRKIVRMGTLLVVGTAFLTNVFILISGTMAIQRHAPEIYYPKNVKVAFDWMLQNRMSDNLTLSAPETGSYIPGATGWRVVYGHPLETPNSEQTLAEVEMIFNGSYGQAEISHYLLEKDVRYVFVGPFEREYLGDLGWIKNYPVIYQNPDVTIIRTGAAE